MLAKVKQAERQCQQLTQVKVEFQPGRAPAVDVSREMVSANVDTFLHEHDYRGYSCTGTR